MPKAIPFLIAALLAALLAAYMGWSEVNAARTERDAQIELREAAEARLVNIQKQLRKTSSDYQTSELRLRQLHSTLTDRPTDRGVYKLLCERGNCAPVDPVQTPSD